MKTTSKRALGRSSLLPLFLVLLGPAWAFAAPDRVHTIRLVTGHLYGPGPLEDRGLPPGELRNLVLDDAGPLLKGEIAFANNGGDEPNVPGERLQGGIVDGLLCDGTPINENVDVGYVELMNGNLKLLLAAVGGGPHDGVVHFYLDGDRNWTILDDIGIDPGFEIGVIKIHDFTWSTGPRLLPFSKQTTSGYPGGMDRAGSRASGEHIPGLLGDDDFDGRLDGVFNAIGSFPLSSAFLPGAPFAQTRRFESDIPVDASTAAALTLVNARNYLAMAEELAAKEPGARGVDELSRIGRERLELVERHLRAASDDAARRVAALAGDPALSAEALTNLSDELFSRLRAGREDR
jgi:hypothetical protein